MLRDHLRYFRPGCLLPLPSDPALWFPAAERGGGHCGPMRHFVTRQRINVNVAAARLLARSLARMCLLVPSPPPPPPPNRSRRGPPCRPRPRMRGRAVGGPARLPRSRQPRCASEEPPVQPKEKARRARGPEEASKARSPPPPTAWLNAERGTADPVHPASPLPPSQSPLAGHYPSTPRSPPNTSSPRRRRRRPESGWGRPGGGFTSILRPDSPLPTRVQYGTERKRRGQSSRDALSARRRPGGGGASWKGGVANWARRGTGRAGWPAEGGGVAGRGSARASPTSSAAPPLPPFALGRPRGRQLGLSQWRAPTSGERLVTARHRRKRPLPFFSRSCPLPHVGRWVCISEFISFPYLNKTTLFSSVLV